MSTVDELGKLDTLRQSGVLTQEEFDAEKAKLLAGDVSSPDPGLAQPSGSDRSDERRSNAGLLVVIGVIVVVAVAIGAFFVGRASAPKTRTAHNSTSRPNNSGAAVNTTEPLNNSGAADDTTAESNLQTAFTGAKTYFEGSNQTYAGILNSTTYSNITQVDTGLAYVPGSKASTNVGTISIQSQAGGEVVLLTAYVPSSGNCFGIVDVASPTGLPAWLSGVAVGTYYLQVNQAIPGSCKATDPSVEQAILYPNGWP